MNIIKEIGKHFGYPECCTDWFLARRMWIVPFKLDEHQEKVHNHQGFIPCPICAKKVSLEEIQIEDLITDREHPLPYPEQDNEYMEEFAKKWEDE